MSELNQLMGSAINEYEFNARVSNDIRNSILHDKEVREDLELFLQQPLYNYSETRLSRYTDQDSFLYNGFNDYLNRKIFRENKTNLVYIFDQDSLALGFEPHGKIDIIESNDIEEFIELQDKNEKKYFIKTEIRDIVTYETFLVLMTEHEINNIGDDVIRIQFSDSVNFSEKDKLEGFNFKEIRNSFDNKFSVAGYISYGTLIINNIFYFIIITLLLMISANLSLKKTKQNISVYQNRMQRLLDGINILVGDDLSLTIDAHEEDVNDEIEEIRVQFNYMIERINNYVDNVYRLEMSQAKSELKMLHSQINPHFVYNTLEVIRMNALIDGNEDLAEMIFNFSSLFRISINSENHHTIKQEIEFLTKYMELFKLRYPDTFDYKIECDEELLDTNILKFLVQPVVENSIIHGFDLSEPNNFVSVIFKSDPDGLIINIIDNGLGFNPDSIKDNDSIALNNIEERLKIEYGNESNLKIHSDKNKTEISIMIRK